VPRWRPGTMPCPARPDERAVRVFKSGSVKTHVILSAAKNPPRVGGAFIVLVARSRSERSKPPVAWSDAPDMYALPTLRGLFGERVGRPRSE
jgi:hypothetical protein